MARFRFSLQAVLQQREWIEIERQRAVAALEDQRLRLENQIRQCHRAIVAERIEQGGFLSQGDLRSARLQAAAAQGLDAAARRAVLELAGVHQRLETARAQLVEAMKERKAVELLRQRRLDEWNLQQNRRDAAAVDEIAIMQAARKEGNP